MVFIPSCYCLKNSRFSFLCREAPEKKEYTSPNFYRSFCCYLGLVAAGCIFAVLTVSYEGFKCLRLTVSECGDRWNGYAIRGVTFFSSWLGGGTFSVTQVTPGQVLCWSLALCDCGLRDERSVATASCEGVFALRGFCDHKSPLPSQKSCLV